MSGLHHVGVRPRSLRYYTTERHSVMPARFRFTPNSGHVRCNSACLLCANSGHSTVYSITSSARFCTDCGTAMPSALAVLRLMSSSTFVACCTGKSAGFSPLRIRPT